MGQKNSSRRKESRNDDKKTDLGTQHARVTATSASLEVDTGSCRDSEHAWMSVASSSPLPSKHIHDSDISSLDVILPRLHPDSPVGLSVGDFLYPGSSRLPGSAREDESTGILNRAKSAINPVTRAYSGVPGTHAPTRSRSLPANSSRRADINLDHETMRKVIGLQERLKIELSRRTEERKKSVPEITIKQFMNAICDSWIYGMQSLEGIPGADRGMVGGPLPKHVVVKCIKGAKGGLSDTSPNQDNYSYTLTKSGYELYTVQDGHGTSGHVVSYRTIRTLPYFILKSKHFPKDISASIQEGYQRCQEDLLKDSVENGYDIQISGCACVLMIRKDNKIWVSHTGDSRLVVGKLGSTETVFESKDHKPTSPSEKKRLEDKGSVVMAFEYEDGQVSISRVFVKGTDYPGLCMSRSLGDQSVKEHGVTAEPDIHELEVETGKTFIVLASDGVWEFISSKLVVSSLSKKIPSEGSAKCAERILTESKKRWRQYEGSYCDDITAMVINLT
jgi:serine/threonine protein phosphatase PrpC